MAAKQNRVGAKQASSALKVAHLAEGAAAAHRESPQQKRQRIAELEERARLFGDSAKQSAQARVLERKWLRFLLVHGEEYSFTPTTSLYGHSHSSSSSARRSYIMLTPAPRRA